MARLFEDDTETSVHFLLATKQGDDEIVKSFIECFREKSVQCRHGMMQETLVETCRHNFKTNVLVMMGAVESIT